MKCLLLATRSTNEQINGTGRNTCMCVYLCIDSTIVIRCRFLASCCARSPATPTGGPDLSGTTSRQGARGASCRCGPTARSWTPRSCRRGWRRRPSCPAGHCSPWS
uniref:Uncharacterized protein n=1 Tax=Triticum urartu TaxID=4572 RepID=A0A8R7QHK4_TRIUA